MSTEPLDFPPFIPAKPKGGVAAEIKEAGLYGGGGNAAEIARQRVVDGVADAFKPKRKRRTKVEMELVPGFVPTITKPAPVDSFAVYVKIVELLEPVPQKIRMEIVRMLMDYHT